MKKFAFILFLSLGLTINAWASNDQINQDLANALSRLSYLENQITLNNSPQNFWYSRGQILNVLSDLRGDLTDLAIKNSQAIPQRQVFAGNYTSSVYFEFDCSENRSPQFAEAARSVAINNCVAGGGHRCESFGSATYSSQVQGADSNGVIHVQCQVSATAIGFVNP